MICIQLFFEYFKTGLFAVGGGLATLPFLSDMALRTGWFTQAQLADMVAVAESTPGPIGVNTATYVGFTVAGIPGALAATLGLVTPSVIVILLVAGFLQSFRDNRYVIGAFYGIRPASTGLIASAGVSVMLVALFRAGTESIFARIDWKAVALAALILFLTRGCKKTKKLHPIIFILFSAAVGILFQFGH